MSDAGGVFKIQYWEKIKKLKSWRKALKVCSKGKSYPKKPYNEVSERLVDAGLSYSTF